MGRLPHVIGDLRPMLRERTGDITDGEPVPGTDPVFLAASRPADPARLATLREHLVPTGALWVVSPRGQPGIADAVVIAATKPAGLVDNKMVRFSASHTALRLVIRRALRVR